MIDMEYAVLRKGASIQPSGHNLPGKPEHHLE